MGNLQTPRPAVWPNLDHRNHVQTQKPKIIQVISGKRLTPEMGVHQSQAAQTPRPATKTPNLRDLEFLSITDNHIPYRSIPAHQDPNLTSNLVGNRGQVISKFGRHDEAGINFSSIGSFQCSDLSGLNS